MANGLNEFSDLESVMDTVLDGLIIIDENGLIQSFNPAATRIFGYHSEEVIGKSINILMPSPHCEEHDSTLANYITTSTPKVIDTGREVEAKHKDGKIFPLWISVNEIDIQNTKMFVSTIRDRTEHYNAQQALQNSEFRLRAIVENTVDGLITIDEFGTVESFNKACEVIFGYDANEVIGQNVKILMPDPYHSEHDDYLTNYAATGEKKIIGIGREVKGQRKNGEIFPLDLSVSKVEAINRRIYSGIVRDITERKTAEKLILQSNEELERFAFIASHDLQEPLRMISSFTTLLKEEYGETMNEEASVYMGFIVDASTRMQKLVTDLLEYSRIGSENSNYTEFDATEQLDIALANLKSSITNGNIEISADPLPRLYINASQFCRVIENLISNAVKYRDVTRPTTIHISAQESDSVWTFSVKDNGIGIEARHIDQIFIIFKRLHNNDEYSGTGIGLAECKRIVELSGGKIWVESEKDKGSTFFFSIPRTT